jgi:hypothetical protein
MALSILNPKRDLDPAVKKKIAHISVLVVPCIFCSWLLLARFVMASPPAWLDVSLWAAVLLSSYFGGKIYRLRTLLKEGTSGILLRARREIPIWKKVSLALQSIGLTFT